MNTISRVIRDERTEAQKVTHTKGVIACDNFLSGWGNAEGSTSWCAWACDPDVDIEKVLKWVKNRSDMINSMVVDLRTFKLSALYRCAHLSIYVCGPEHIAAQ